MAALNKVPKSLHGEIMKMTSEGVSSEKICVWLLEEHNIKIHDTNIQRLINKYKTERQEVAKIIYAEEVVRTVNKDLEITEKVLSSLHEEYFEAIQTDKKTAIAFAETLKKYLEFRSSLVGSPNNSGSPITAEKAEEILSSLLGD
jgi:hypothetical protein